MQYTHTSRILIMLFYVGRGDLNSPANAIEGRSLNNQKNKITIITL
jgi:hypothetical protein